MKTVILCGGLGTRFAEETDERPKPMIEIGGLPILSHILQIYEASGFHDFVLALGYKSEYIKSYFEGDPKMTRFRANAVHHENRNMELVDTGAGTMTGGRLAKVGYLLEGQTFMLTYGDGVCDIDMNELLSFHRSHGKLATVTAVRPKERFGVMRCEAGVVTSFREKIHAPDEWVNGGFFVFEPEVLEYIEGDSTELERSVLRQLSDIGQLMAYQHEGFWACMDTLHDKRELEQLWEGGKAPWKVWKDYHASNRM
ncbi:sugar phosphate nucleotidyltransferase [Paenibacillus prosopidis]|uniref:Glucose-1-phosphate cytidylyltransferase n=1 Tax=Paenibacillus prosopidis TaxID=630520 RepID=A0A368VPR1_9BACL|nr:sugar phosphate nucleotidyltransferase [Paenibacillus prosopidis]RCW43488.1 glucose-1-phosphate cytidylyltransferase [Paenibacillus prosopidis]